MEVKTFESGIWAAHVAALLDIYGVVAVAHCRQCRATMAFMGRDGRDAKDLVQGLARLLPVIDRISAFLIARSTKGVRSTDMAN